MCWKNEDGSGNSSSTLSRVSILVGFICALSYFGAFVGTGWVYTKESYRLTNLNLYTSVTFKIGLWKTCHSFKRINATIMLPPAGCTVISYFNWSDVTSHSLGINSDVEPTLDVLTRIRWCTVFVGFGFILLLIGFVYSVFGHFYQDNKTLLASAIYTLSGLSMAAGLFVLVCVLTDSFAGTSTSRPASTSTAYPHASELQLRNWSWSWNWNWGVYEARTSGWRDYKYGWCFVTAGAACVLVEMVAVLCITVHYRRCHTIALLIKSLVPRSLEPNSRNAYFALAKDAGLLLAAAQQRHAEPVHPCESARREEAASGLGSATPPDLCSTFLKGAEQSSPSDAQPAESSVAGREAQASHGAGKRANCARFATLDTRNYRCLDYSAATVRKYSTLASAGCKALASPQSQHVASPPPSATVGGPVRWCHPKTSTAPATATATLPRMKSACCACANTNAGKWRAADKQAKRAQLRQLSCDDLDL